MILEKMRATKIEFVKIVIMKTIYGEDIPDNLSDDVKKHFEKACHNCASYIVDILC